MFKWFLQITDSFQNISYYGLFWALAILTVTSIIIIAIRDRKAKQLLAMRHGHYNPHGLFDEILTQLDLSRHEKMLLCEMIKGARLKHPAIIMLSPGMIEYACDLWRMEKGPSYVTKEKRQAIKNISIKLFDHYNETKLQSA